MPLEANFKPPSRKRGWGCVAANLHTPLSPLFRGESQKTEIPILLNYLAMNILKKILILSFFLIISLMVCKTSFAGVSYTLSRSADYSTDDRAFLNTDTIYIQVAQNILDYREIKKSFFSLQPNKTKRKTKHSLEWDDDINAFTGSASLESYAIGDKITVLMNLQGNNDKDKIIRKARFVIGYSGQWQLTGTVYEETQGKDKQSIADARVRIQGIADISEDEEDYYPEKEDTFILSDG